MVSPDHFGGRASGVFSSDRAIGFYPFNYIFDVLSRGDEVNIELAFNMMGVGVLNGRSTAGSYTNIISHIARIVP